MYLLFTIPNCGICNNNKRQLEQKQIEFQEIKVMESDKNQELARKYNVRMGGTIIDSNTGKVVDVNDL